MDVAKHIFLYDEGQCQQFGASIFAVSQAENSTYSLLHFPSCWSAAVLGTTWPERGKGVCTLFLCKHPLPWQGQCRWSLHPSSGCPSCSLSNQEPVFNPEVEPTGSSFAPGQQENLLLHKLGNEMLERSFSERVSWLIAS